MGKKLRNRNERKTEKERSARGESLSEEFWVKEQSLRERELLQNHGRRFEKTQRHIRLKKLRELVRHSLYPSSFKYVIRNVSSAFIDRINGYADFFFLRYPPIDNDNDKDA